MTSPCRVLPARVRRRPGEHGARRGLARLGGRRPVARPWSGPMTWSEADIEPGLFPGRSPMAEADPRWRQASRSSAGRPAAGPSGIDLEITYADRHPRVAPPLGPAAVTDPVPDRSTGPSRASSPPATSAWRRTAEGRFLHRRARSRRPFLCFADRDAEGYRGRARENRGKRPAKAIRAPCSSMGRSSWPDRATTPELLGASATSAVPIAVPKIPAGRPGLLAEAIPAALGLHGLLGPFTAEERARAAERDRPTSIATRPAHRQAFMSGKRVDAGRPAG